VEEELRRLYKLQQIDLELDELDDRGGELPAEVETLQQRAETISQAISAEDTKLHEIRKTRSDSQIELQELRDRVRMLNERLRTVRNNKEYDATTTEIASAESEQQRLERQMTTFDTQEAAVMKEIESLSRQREEMVRELEEKHGTLTMLRETNADEISELRSAREELKGQIDQDLMKRYEFIRTAYPDAVVKVRKGACSGCYRAITPQTLVEMRRGDRLFTCQHCNRILVHEDVAASVSL